MLLSRAFRHELRQPPAGIGEIPPLYILYLYAALCVGGTTPRKAMD